MSTENSIFNLKPLGKYVNLDWGWTLVLGIVLLYLGFIAYNNLVTATSATILYVGIMISIGGALEGAAVIAMNIASKFGTIIPNQSKLDHDQHYNIDDPIKGFLPRRNN